MPNIKKQDAAYWTVLAILLLVLVYLFSSHHFSLVFTLAGTIQTFGFGLVAVKIKHHRSVSGLSLYTFLCYTIVFSIRAVLFMVFKGYLPSDATGDTVFRMQEIVATVLAAYIFYCIGWEMRGTYDKIMDSVKSWPLIAAAAAIAVLFHSSLNNSLLGDYLWAFTQYLETVAILPQFLLFRNKGDVQTTTSHFVAAQGISRVLFIVFWVFTYAELNTDKSMSLLSQYAGYWFMLTQLVHLGIMADFMYY